MMLHFVCSSAIPVDENRRVSSKRDSYEDEEEDFGGEEMEEESDGSSDSEDDLDSPRLIRENCAGKCNTALEMVFRGFSI